MRKLWTILLMGLLILPFRSLPVNAEDVYIYEFDSITITEAYRFQITVEAEPVAGSVLEGQVSVGEILTVYVGSLVFANDGTDYNGTESMIVLTKQDDTSFVKYLNNSFSTDLTTYRTYSYGNWKLLDPAVGVVKDFTIPVQYQITINYQIIENNYQFIDNKGTVYNMIPGSYVLETPLNIVVKATPEA